MLYKGTMGSVMSGKIGGMVASHNKGGTYFRHLRIPTNPRTPEQHAVRNTLSGLAAAWKTLTADQQSAWAVYATNSPKINRVGDSTKIPALAWYIASNTPRIQAGFTRIDDAPTIFGLATLSPLTPDTFTAGPPSTVDVDFDATNDWATALAAVCSFTRAGPRTLRSISSKDPINSRLLWPGLSSPPPAPLP